MYKVQDYRWEGTMYGRWVFKNWVLIMAIAICLLLMIVGALKY